MDEPPRGGPLPGAPRFPAASDVVFTADFASTAQWVAGRSRAFPGGGPAHPDEDRLDRLVPDPGYCRSGVFRATPRADGRWDTGLLTTEGSREGFTVRPGDVLEARVRLPRETGAWPAIRTWRDGGQGVDVFEYHVDNPGHLEFTNRVRSASCHLHDDAIRPGAWVDLRTEFGPRCVIWSLNGASVFADHRGVGHAWRAHLVVALSVCAGRYHPSPEPGTGELSFEVGSLTVRRPFGGARAAYARPV
ncbi:beta-glucanase [Streptomyces sp. MB22_4]|uniref:beta-glucanase n=1 Tax=Streptomyces sp. MB22_4 TaxID=3383120 RepID=UPI0039A300BF